MEETQNGPGVLNNTGSAIRSRAQDIREGLEERIDGVRGYAGDIDGFVRQSAQERPVLTLVCAVGLGFLIGRLASRI
jgi:hypothetical protein